LLEWRCDKCYNDAMTSKADRPGNRSKVDQLEAVMADALADTLRDGFFGTVMVEVAVENGSIQTIRRVVGKFER